MKTVTKTSIIVGLVLAFSAGPSAFAATDLPHAPIPASRDRPDFAAARALAPVNRFQPARGMDRPEPDGLGRNDDDCKFGCVDH